MKKRTVIIALLCVSLFYAYAFAQLSFDVTLKQDMKLDDAPAGAGGNAENEAYSAWDFGPVRKGSIVEHEFIFANNTLNPVKIVGLDSSCGCAVSEVAKKTIPPGENTAIKVKFDSADYLGPVKQYIYVHTDDKEHPLRKLVIKANVYK